MWLRLYERLRQRAVRLFFFGPVSSLFSCKPSEWWVTHVRQGRLHVLTSASGSGCQAPRHISPTETEKTTSLWFISLWNHEIEGKVRFSQFVISPVLAGVLLYIFSVSVMLFQNMITTFSAKVSVVFQSWSFNRTRFCTVVSFCVVGSLSIKYDEANYPDFEVLHF